MHIVHVAESINRGFGGAATAVAQQANCVAEAGLGSCEILAFDYQKLGEPLPTASKVRCRLVRPGRPHLLGWSSRFRDAIADAAEARPAVFHLHSLWRFPILWASRTSHEVGIPTVMSPHGSLQPAARAHRRLRKRLLWRPFQRALARASTLCATSEREAASLRELLPQARVVVIPLGVDARQFEHGGNDADSRTVLFLSRLHPIKGLPHLLEAWSRLRPAGWTLTVAGQDEGGQLAEARRFVARSGISDSVEFVGPVYGAAKRRLLAGAALFVLPTLSENFGLVVAEALAASVPVITTRGAPWEDLVTHRCGWWIDTGAGPMAEALEHALSLDAGERIAMGRRGRELARRKYDLGSVARELAALYRSVASPGRN